MFEDTKYFNYIFNILLEKEKTIVQIKRNEMPEDENNTVLSGIKNELYYWYTKKYFPMDNLEKFEEKLKFVKQFIEQQEYAKSVNKKYVVFAPNIANATKTAYNKNNIDIVTTKNDLLRIIKEYEK